ncbi:hypothetical protein B9L23_01995 [Parageobacillus galactosidasius]|uniref:Uncharacterized protein n=1 Tax=Parageobacillus galactosidasius TaxID=883812 RepID=A0A226QN13_9BACL|nr:hypothetical protein B9L23_01995 [Parageobacillus galactosidasius]
MGDSLLRGSQAVPRCYEEKIKDEMTSLSIYGSFSNNMALHHKMYLTIRLFSDQGYKKCEISCMVKVTKPSTMEEISHAISVYQRFDHFTRLFF